MTVPNTQPTLPAETALSDLEKYFISLQPVNLWPTNQNSNFGLFRQLICLQLEEATDLLDELTNESFITTSEGYLSLWETELGLPRGQGGRTIAQRRAALLARRAIGPFTRERRDTLIERFMAETFGAAPAFGTGGLVIGSGILLHSGVSVSARSFYVVENITNFSYDVRIIDSASPDTASLTRELLHITPAHLSFTITPVHDPFMVATGALTLSGNEIKDSNRTAATSWATTQSGGSSDGVTPPGGMAIEEAATNLFRNGQCDATTDWPVSGSGMSRAIDTGVDPPFSTQSIAITSTGASANPICTPQSATGQAAAAGVIGAGSVWFKGVASASYKISMRWINSDASSTTGSATTFNATGGWQKLIPPTLAVAAGKTGDQLRIVITLNGTRAETFWAAHAMLQKNVGVVGDYVATNGGSTATRSDARVRIPVSGVINATQSWFAMAFSARYAPTVNQHGAGSSPTYFQYADDSNNIIVLNVNDDYPVWNFYRLAAGVGVGINITPVFVSGDTVIVICAWEAGLLKMKDNVSALVSVPNSSIPTLAATTADIGSAGGTTHMNQRALWMALGNGKLSNADISALIAKGANIPFAGDVSAEANVTAILPFVDGTYYVQV